VLLSHVFIYRLIIIFYVIYATKIIVRFRADAEPIDVFSQLAFLIQIAALFFIVS